jgi:hypothetical protein
LLACLLGSSVNIPLANLKCREPMVRGGTSGHSACPIRCL